MTNRMTEMTPEAKSYLDDLLSQTDHGNVSPVEAPIREHSHNEALAPGASEYESGVDETAIAMPDSPDHPTTNLDDEKPGAVYAARRRRHLMLVAGGLLALAGGAHAGVSNYNDKRDMETAVSSTDFTELGGYTGEHVDLTMYTPIYFGLRMTDDNGHAYSEYISDNEDVTGPGATRPDLVKWLSYPVRGNFVDDTDDGKEQKESRPPHAIVNAGYIIDVLPSVDQADDVISRAGKKIIVDRSGFELWAIEAKDSEILHETIEVDAASLEGADPEMVAAYEGLMMFMGSRTDDGRINANPMIGDGISQVGREALSDWGCLDAASLSADYLLRDQVVNLIAEQSDLVVSADRVEFVNQYTQPVEAQAAVGRDTVRTPDYIIGQPAEDGTLNNCTPAQDTLEADDKPQLDIENVAHNKQEDS